MAPHPGIPAAIDEVVNSLHFIYPEIFLGCAFLAVIFIDLLLPRKSLALLLTITLISLTVAAGLTCLQVASLPGHPVFNGMVWPTRTGAAFKLIVYIASFLFALFSFFHKTPVAGKKGAGDLFSVLLGVTIGMSLMTMATHLLMIYLSVEMVSIGSYLLVGYSTTHHRQAEAALKYALFGAFSSAMMLYGMSLLYAFTGTLSVVDAGFAGRLATAPAAGSGIALTLVLAGIGFKLSAVPMHLWSPDVYEGAPMPVTAFLSAAPKLAGLALLVILLQAVAGGETRAAYPALSALAILSLIVGNFAAIWQDNIKRMLAYSGIGHTGFMLMAVAAGPAGEPALLYYGLAYTLMIMAVFLLADHLEEQTGTAQISGYKGFGKRFPLAMVTLVILLISLTGIPPTAGFFGKLLIFNAVWGQYRTSGNGLAQGMLAAGAITTVVSLFYYFKIPLNAFLRSGEPGTTVTRTTGPKVYLAAGLLLLVLLMGIFPQVVQRLF